jgi:tRNA A-37 threonylcarbamoyl transferase component Bud32
MPFVEINARYREVLAQQGLHTPEDFLGLPCVIVCGHPDRHVARTEVGAIRAFLKREHRVRWKERILNVLDGFGFVSKSYREALILRELERQSVGCPEWIAVGEDRKGRAFLLLGELKGAVEIRIFLRDSLAARPLERPSFFRKLGETLAHLHHAGFHHPDLYSKHVLIHPGDEEISFLDWQRSRRHHSLSWHRRWHGLAALSVTLPEELANPRERLVCLKAYLERSRSLQGNRCVGIVQAARQILSLERQLMRCRRIQDLRNLPVILDSQRLIWQDGEALCLTPELKEALGDHIPTCLALSSLPKRPRRFLSETSLSTPLTDQALLVRRREIRPLQGLWSWLQRRRPESRETSHARLIFRLERCGVPTPRLLAFGQRHGPAWRIESLLLTEPIPDTVSLRSWLANECIGVPRSGELNERRQLIRETASLLRRIHDAKCYFDAIPNAKTRSSRTADHFPLEIQYSSDEKPTVVLSRVDAVSLHRRKSRKSAERDLVTLSCMITCAGCSRTDVLRLVLEYFKLQRLTAAAKRLARALLAQSFSTSSSRRLHAPVCRASVSPFSFEEGQGS